MSKLKKKYEVFEVLEVGYDSYNMPLTELKKLKEKQLAAEAAAEAAKKEFEHYANVIIPSEMHSCGINSISLASGGSLSIKHNFYHRQYKIIMLLYPHK